MTSLDATRFMPRQVMEEHKSSHMDVCCHCFECYHNEGENFLNHIIMWGETHICCYEPKGNKQNMQWKHTTCVSKKFTLWPPAGKLVLTVFCASPGPMCEHYLQVDWRQDESNKCTLFWHTSQWTVTSHSLKSESNPGTGYFLVHKSNILILLRIMYPSFKYWNGKLLTI